MQYLNNLITVNWQGGKNPKLFSRFYHSSRPQTENKGKQKEWQILGPCQRIKKAVEHEGDGDTNFSWWAWNIPKILEKRLE